MSDFISLSCPYCGGKLDISQKTKTLVCQYCGAEHLIRRDAYNVILETSELCPICNKNDKVEKISSILNNPSSLLSTKFSQPPMPLAPSKPHGFGCFQWGVFVMLIYSLLAGIGYIITSLSGEFNPTLNIILLILAVPIFILLLIIFGIASKSKRKQNIEKYDSIEIPNWQEDKVRWEKAKNKWDRLYYCYRNDVVFDPETWATCKPDKFAQFLFED